MLCFYMAARLADSLGSYNNFAHFIPFSPAKMSEHSFEPLKNDLLLRAARGGFIAIRLALSAN